ncbi:TetR/AcrR family transcriptional regulator [Sanguibacter sp. 25GB23B1]|uniref:TetR/AcrR family transcriptional regulator n=1 Tax=unclassified Sanguibacter TaxID=2645534 RepID=UPI0032AEAED0
MTRDTPRTRLEPADRRRDLLRTADSLARTVGLDGLTAQTVAATARASKALIFHYFGSVVGLQRAVATVAVHDLLTATHPPDHLARTDRPRALLDAFITAVTARREVWTDIWGGALRADPETQTMLADARSELVDRMASGVAERSPGDPADEQPRIALLSLGWVALAENVTAAWLAGSTLSQDELLDLLVGSLTALLGPAENAPGTPRP